MHPSDLLLTIMSENTLVSEFDRLNLWGKFYSISWSKLLVVQPQFMEKAKESKNGRTALLSITHRSTDKCNK